MTIPLRFLAGASIAELAAETGRSPLAIEASLRRFLRTHGWRNYVAGGRWVRRTRQARRSKP